MPPTVHERRIEERRLIERRSVAVLPLEGEPEGGWQSSAELIGCTVEAADGAVGLIEDLRFEAESLAIAGLVIDAPDSLSAGLRLVLPLGSVERIDWPQRKVYLRGTREEIQRFGAGES